MKYLILVLLMAGFVSAVDVDFDCPSSVFVDKEFECSLEISDGDGIYDVKVELDQERNSVLKIWDKDNDKWLSGYYYLTEFIEDDDEVDVKLKVSEAGNYDGKLKLRQGDKRELFEIEIDVMPSRILNNVSSQNNEQMKVNETKNEMTVLGEKVSEDIILNERVVYESGDWKVVNNLIYGFAIFLIFIIGILIWERF